MLPPAAGLKGDKAEGCAKIGYVTRGAARYAIKKMTRTHRGAGGLRPYKCSRCPYWHIGRGVKTKKWRRSRERGGAGGKNYGDAGE